MRRVAEQPSCARPRVSVAMVTYNHEKFIARAIDSVLMQETDFSVELVIGEDCSTDGTRSVVQEYARKYPHAIRPLLPAGNLGAQKNFVNVIQACTGEFIAYLEGDDLWINNRKLTKQVAFLESSSDCVSCFHNVISFSDDQGSLNPDLSLSKTGNRLMCRRNMKTRLSQADLFKGNAIPTCSVMFRRKAIENLPPWFEELPIGDLPLHILCAQHGLAAYLDEVMGAYRLHPNSSWSSKLALVRLPLEIRMYDELERHFRALPPSAAVRQGRLHSLRALARARGKLELARARQLLDSRPEAVPATVWRAWRHDPRRLKWLMWYVLLVWPALLGGGKTAAIIHRKLVRKF